MKQKPTANFRGHLFQVCQKRCQLLQTGFTLVECIITIAIAAVALSFAIPSFISTIQNNYAITLSQELINALQLARSEAIKRNSPVSVCATRDQNFNQCGSNWNNGWLIFVDPSGNGTYGAGSTLLKTYTPTGSNANILPTPSLSAATYNAAGFATSNTSNMRFQISAAGCTGDHVRNITISFTGHLTVTKTNCP